MAFTVEDLEAIDQAIASGELTVKINNREVTYRTIAELLKARRFIASLLARRAGVKTSALGNYIVTRVDREVT